MKYFVTLVLLLGFLSILIFRDIPQLYFFSDDFIWLLDAKQDPVEKVSSYFVDSEGFFYRPVTKTYFWAMWRLVGDNAFWYHVVNLVMHFLITILVYFLARLLLSRVVPKRFPTYALPVMALGTATLFFVHPAHLESIIWASVITELIPAVCVVGGLLLAERYFTTKRIGFLFGLLLSFVIGLGAHEYMVIFPALVFITQLYLVYTSDQTVKSKNWKVITRLIARYRVQYVLLTIITAGYFLIRWIANSHWSGGDYSYNLVRLPFNIVGNLFGYFGLLVVGIPFVEWYFQLRFFLRDQLAVAGLLLVVGLLLTCGLGWLVWQHRRSRALYFFIYCVLFFIITLLPFLGLGGLAERYAYLPSVGFFLLISYSVFLLAVWIRTYTDSVADFTAYGLILGIFALYWIISIQSDQMNWKLASEAVDSRLDEFRYKCETFKQGETLVRISPPNRLGRAWLYQVGYEEGANLYCDKDLKIQRR